MEQDEEGPSMSSKEENIENLPFFGEAHRESASLFLFLLVMDTYGYTPVVPACSRNEQRRIAGERALSLSLYQQKVNYGIIPKKRNRTRRSLSYTFHLSTLVRPLFLFLASKYRFLFPEFDANSIPPRANNVASCPFPAYGMQIIPR